jgi:hypothetical protein
MLPKKTNTNTNPREAAEEAALQEWASRTAQWEAMAKTQGVQMPPGVKIDPKDVRVEVGPPMTMEEFKAWHERRKNIMKKYSQ